jgi:hypothetical protein
VTDTTQPVYLYHGGKKLYRARDRSGNTFGAAKRLERIARFFCGLPQKNAPVEKGD